jgi:hypothetical protein
MSYVPMNNTYMAPAPQYTYAQPAVYSTSQIPMQSPAPVTYTAPPPVTYAPAPAPMPMTRAIEMPAQDADAPPGYRLAGYAPAPDSGNLPEGWEFVNGKWIYVGKPEPEPMPQMRAVEVPVTNYTSVAIPQPVTYAPQPVTYTQPQVFATQQMPLTYGSVPPVAQYY